MQRWGGGDREVIRPDEIECGTWGRSRWVGRERAEKRNHLQVGSGLRDDLRRKEPRERMIGEGSGQHERRGFVGKKGPHNAFRDREGEEIQAKGKHEGLEPGRSVKRTLVWKRKILKVLK